MANQRTIAQALGISQTTVSLAFRDHPSIPSTTKQRVLEEAKRLGYQNNAYVSILMAQIRSGRPVRDRGCIAILADFPSREKWLSNETYQKEYEGIVQRAEELGFRTECFFLRAPEMNATKVDKILQARGITGLILAPPRFDNQPLIMNWSHYSISSIAFNWSFLGIHRVASHHIRNVGTAFDQLILRGYQRIGLCLPPIAMEPERPPWLAGFLYKQYHTDKKNHLPVFSGTPGKTPLKTFSHWLSRWKPDAIISLSAHEQPWLDALGLRAPEDLGFVCANRPLNSHYAGIEEHHEQIGAAAVEVVVSQIQQNKLGLPQNPQITLIEGSWTEGNTLRPLKEAPTTVGHK